MLKQFPLIMILHQISLLVQVILDLVNPQIVNILDLLNIFLHAKTEITR